MPDPATLDFRDVEVLTFDCYGTLIDWETGILAGLRIVVGDVGTDDQLLEAYARAEAAIEAGPYLAYRRVLGEALARVTSEVGVEATATQQADFGASVVRWPAFADSAAALRRLRDRYRLGVITNCDDDLFAASNRRLGEPFEWIVTAEQVGSYKPNRHSFEVALERVGRPSRAIVHVAQSLYHDVVPAKAIGLSTAWINRRHSVPGSGATPPAAAQPDLTAPNMAAFAELALA